MKVRFNDVSEYCSELADHGPPSMLVRNTRQYSQRQQLPVNDLFVISGFLNERGEHVELKVYCGEVWRMKQNDKTEGKADDFLEIIRNHAERLGYEVRPGTFGEIDS